MVRSIHMLSVLLLLALASVVRGQTPLTCGIVEIDGPAKLVAGEPLVFKARIAGVSHTTKTELKWKLSAGTISTGQGTGEISVDTAGLGGVDVIATAELSGVPLGCNGSATRTTQIEAAVFRCGLGIRFDEYGDLQFEDEKARLDNFAIQLTNDPLMIGYIFMSAGQKTFENEAAERLERAKSYLVNRREVDAIRLVTHDCGFAKDLRIQLFLGPLGASPPVCSDIDQIPLSEVNFTKPRPKATKKNR